ncbi:MAG TPA: gliding motility protein GldC [Thermodesulfobacteriota bacterium]|jgi:gliding motility-associated protein GldC
MSKEAEIIFKVMLDEENIPESIHWDATDSDIEGLKPCSAMLISIWDHERKNSLSIDLWTKEMTVEEINIHYFQTIIRMAETYQRATSNKEIADMIKRFGSEFADRAVEEFSNKSE